MSPTYPPLQGTFSLPLLIVLFSLMFSSSSAFPLPEIAPTQPISLTPLPPPLPATIPAFPEQSDAAGCPLDLPADLFHTVKAACGGPESSGKLRRGRCCPVLAAWLYAAYSGTALRRAAAVAESAAAAFEMPLLPDDSETCEGDLEEELKRKGMELARVNATCDLAYCYCGIRLHPVSCPAAFAPSVGGKIAGGRSVRRLERACLSGGCSKCLESIGQLDAGKIRNGSRSRAGEEEEERVSKMHRRDCEVMGFTWLLAKNASAYFRTVSMALRAVMMAAGGSDPPSCALLGRDGMPLAVDSSQLPDQSSSNALRCPRRRRLSALSLCAALSYYMILALSSFMA